MEFQSLLYYTVRSKRSIDTGDWFRELEHHYSGIVGEIDLDPNKAMGLCKPLFTGWRHHVSAPLFERLLLLLYNISLFIHNVLQGFIMNTRYTITTICIHSLCLFDFSLKTMIALTWLNFG